MTTHATTTLTFTAMYLSQYPDFEVEVQGVRLDIDAVRDSITLLKIQPIDLENEKQARDLELAISIWRIPVERQLYFCDAAGIAVHTEALATRRAPGVHITASLCGPTLTEWHNEDRLMLAFSDQDVSTVLSAARLLVKEHLLLLERKERVRWVSSWQLDGSYPFTGEPSTDLERTQRQVFDVIAGEVAHHVRDLVRGDVRHRRVTLGLLREALETSSSHTRAVFESVLRLPKKRAEELSELLEHTDLDAMIAAARVVADRLNVLASLNAMCLDPAVKKHVRERKQLHRLLARNAWVFGDEWTLAVDDRALTEVLKAHLSFLGRESLNDAAEVRDVDGHRRIVDLMLTKAIRGSKVEREHLIVELKAPKVTLRQKELTQIQGYAAAVAGDSRFASDTTKWTFVLIGSKTDEFVDLQRGDAHRPFGLVNDFRGPRFVQIWVKTWNEILPGAESRLRFFQDSFRYSPSARQGLEHIRKEYPEYFEEIDIPAGLA